MHRHGICGYACQVARRNAMLGFYLDHHVHTGLLDGNSC